MSFLSPHRTFFNYSIRNGLSNVRHSFYRPCPPFSVFCWIMPPSRTGGSAEIPSDTDHRISDPSSTPSPSPTLRWGPNMSVKAADTWSALEYNKTASFVYSTEYTTPVLTLLDPKPGDRVIDFGCGTGEVTLKLSEVVADSGIVVGIDFSQSMASIAALSVERGEILISSFRLTRRRKTGWKTHTPRISSRWTMNLRLDCWLSTENLIRSSATPFCTGANGIQWASSAVSRKC